MQDLSDKKHYAIAENLAQIDRDLKRININNNECQARQLMDCRRQLLADLKSLKLANDVANNSTNWLEYKPTTSSTELVQKWRSRVMLFKPERQSCKESNCCDQILTVFCQKHGILIRCHTGLCSLVGYVNLGSH